MLSSMSSSIEEFLTSKSTTKMDVLQIILVVIFCVHFHKRMPGQPGFPFAQLQRYVVLVTFEFGACLLKICASVKDVFSTPLFPVLLAFVEWYVYRPDIFAEKSRTYASVVKKQDVEARISGARHIFWSGCKNFLKSTLSRNNDELVDRVALWEDRVLQVYAPFGLFYHELKLSGPISCRADENKNRMGRITDVVQKVLQNFETSQLRGDPKRPEINQGGINMPNFKGEKIVDRSAGPSGSKN